MKTKATDALKACSSLRVVLNIHFQGRVPTSSAKGFGRRMTQEGHKPCHCS